MGFLCNPRRSLRSPRLCGVEFGVSSGRPTPIENLHAMRGRQGEVPLDWEEQRGMFEFSRDVAE